MRKYLFYPYRGIYYENGLSNSGIRILIVGDSHYCDEKKFNCPYRDKCLMNPYTVTEPCVDGGRICNFNIDNIVHYLCNGGYKAYIRLTLIFLGIENKISTCEEEKKGKEDVWTHIAYLNYLQKVFGKSESNGENFDFSEKEFEKFISSLEVVKPFPNLIIGLGKNVRGAFTKNMLDRGIPLNPALGEPNKEWLFFGNLLGSKFVFCVLYHPSMKFYSYERHKENIVRIRKAIEMCYILEDNKKM